MFHSCAGAAISGGVPTLVTGKLSLISELYPDHTGIPLLLNCCFSRSCVCMTSSVSPPLAFLVMLRAINQAKSSRRTIIGNSMSANRLKRGFVGHVGLEAGAGQSNRFVTDSGSSFMDLLCPVDFSSLK